MKNSNQKSSYSLPTRILSLIMTILEASGMVVYLIWFIMGFFA